MGEQHYLFNIPIAGHNYGFSVNIIIQWIIIIIVAIICMLLSRNLKKIPDRRQSIAELLVDNLNKLVSQTVGEHFMDLAPYTGALIIFLLVMNLTGLIGIKPPTTDYSVALGMGLTTFLVMQGYVIKKVGLLHYFLGYGKPIFFLAPMNILERVLIPVSLSLRLFGNITAATVIMELVYNALGKLNWFAQLGFPIPLHMYFDIFDGTVQMIVFMMLSIINLKVIAEH